MQGSGNSSRQRESGETSSWVALILWKWSWVTGMTLPLGQVKSRAYCCTLWLHLVKTKTEEMDQWSRWWKPECTDWMSPMSLCLLSVRPGHGFHSILELLAAEHFTFVITRPAFIISFAFISKNIPSIKLVSSFFQIIAKRELRETGLFNLAWKRFHFTSRN